MKKILIISTNFFPKNTSGTLRINAFCRKFLEKGYQVDILTGSAPANGKEENPFKSEKNLNIFRTPVFDVKERFSFHGWLPSFLTIPDRFWPWYFTSRKICNELAGRNYRFMLSSSPVQTAHLIALDLKRRFQWPWVCDFRDPWYFSKKSENCPFYQCAIEKWLESKVIHTADMVTVTNDRFKNYLIHRYHNNIQTISNGFMPEDFSGIQHKQGNENKKVFAHVGSLYGQFRDPTPLLEAIAQLKMQGLLDHDNFSFELIGGGDKVSSPGFRRQLMNLGIDDLVVIIDRLPHRKSLQQMMNADCLVLLQCDKSLKYQVPAKLYEYLRCNKPILGMVNQGATSDILQTINPAWSIHPEDKSGIQDYILKLINGDKNVHTTPSSEVIAGYSRSLQTEKLIELTRRF